MNTQQAQIKVNLPLPMKDYLQSKASKFGMPLAGYIKNLILNDIKDMDYPIYKASAKTEEAYQKAKDEEKNDKLISVNNLDDYFDNL